MGSPPFHDGSGREPTRVLRVEKEHNFEIKVQKKETKDNLTITQTEKSLFLSAIIQTNDNITEGLHTHLKSGSASFQDIGWLGICGSCFLASSMGIL